MLRVCFDRATAMRCPGIEIREVKLQFPKDRQFFRMRIGVHCRSGRFQVPFGCRYGFRCQINVPIILVQACDVDV